MFLAAPIWLFALLPWAAVCLYLLWGRRKRVNVPFLDLWKGPVEGQRVRRKMAAPPLALVLAMLAMALAIVAAARPAVFDPDRTGGQTVTVIVDRGITMSARGDGGEPRYRAALRQVAAALAEQSGAGQPVDVVATPAIDAAPQRTTAGALADVPLSTTAVDPADALAAFVRAQLADGRDPVIVVSDAKLPISDDRLIQVTPPVGIRNVAITAFSARVSPKPQVMVRVRSEGAAADRVTLRVTSAGQSAERVIDMPRDGAPRDWFIDLPQLGPQIMAEIIAADDQPVDNRAWLVRETRWPAIEPAVAVGELGRLIELYRRTRPVSNASISLRIVDQPERLGVTIPGLALAAGGAGATMTRATPTRVVPHPVTDAVQDWPTLRLPVGGGAAPAGWEPLLFSGDRVMLAVREVSGAAAAPVRQAWVAIGTDGWSGDPQYVVFWAALFDWLGRGGEVYASHALAVVSDPDWQPSAGTTAPADADARHSPGVFTRGDGAMRAFHAATPDPRSRIAGGEAWRGNLATRLHAAGSGRWDFTPALALAAMVCVAAAAMIWRRAAGRERWRGFGAVSASAPARSTSARTGV